MLISNIRAAGAERLRPARSLLNATAMTGLLLSGSAALADEAAMAPRNPFLADSYATLTHFDSAQTDAVDLPAPVGVHQIENADARWVPGGLVNISFQVMPPLADGTQYALAANSQQVAKIRIDDNRFELIDLLALPSHAGIIGDDARDIADEFDKRPDEAELLAYANEHYSRWLEDHTVRGGVYNALGRDGTLYIPSNNMIFAVSSTDPARLNSPLEMRYAIDLSDIMGPAGALTDAMFGMNMTWDGTLVFVTISGVLGALKPGADAEIVTMQFPGETITNSIATGEDNGIYVVSSRKMRKVMWMGDRFSTDEADGAWEAEYDVGDRELGGVTLGDGSGSTPSLMGFGDDADKLVVVTDGSRVMNLVAFWRDEIPADFEANPDFKSPRIADQIQVNFGNPDREAAQSEQSVAVSGYGALVVNNSTDQASLPTLLENGLANGVSRPGPLGVEKFSWDPDQNRWGSDWVNDTVGNPTTVPTISAQSQRVYFSQFRDGNWEVSGLNWANGDYDTRIILGPSQRYNGAWSPISFLEDGDIGLGGLLGFMRLETSEFAPAQPEG